MINFTHCAKPVLVRAVQITDIIGNRLSADKKSHDVIAQTPDGEVVMTAAMVSRHTPVVGDYIVTQEDGYVYVNPKDVFERKYQEVPF